MPTTISASDARNNFSDLLSRVLYQHEEFVIERKGKPIAILSPRISETQSQTRRLVKLTPALLKYSLGLKNWKHSKQLLKDLHRPSTS